MKRLFYIAIFLVLPLALSAQAGMDCGWKAHKDLVSSMSFGSASDRMVSAGFDGQVKIWNALTQQEEHSFRASQGRIFSVAMDPLDEYLAYAADDHSVNVFHIREKEVVQTLPGHRGSVFHLSFSPSGKLLASGGADGRLRIWDLEKAEEVHQLVHSGSVLSLAWHPNEKLIASGGSDNEVHLWNAESGQLIRKFFGHNESITALAFNKDGSLLASGSLDTKLLLWDTRNNQFIRRFDEHSRGVNALRFDSKSNNLISGSSDGQLRLYDMDRRSIIRSANGNSGWVVSVAFNPVISDIYAGHQDGRIRCYSFMDFSSPSPRRPVHLAVKNVQFFSEEGRDYLEGKDKGILEFTIENQSEDPAFDLAVLLKNKSGTRGVEFPQRSEIGVLEGGKSRRIKLELQSDAQLRDGNLNLELAFSELNGFEPLPVDIAVKTVAFRQPKLSVVDYSFVNDDGSALKLGETATLQLVVQNIGQGRADSVRLNFRLPSNIFPAEGTSYTLGQMNPGQSRTIHFEFFSNRRYKGDHIEIGIDLSERYDLYGERGTARVRVNQNLASRNQYQFGQQAARHEPVEVRKASLFSDVDRNIPVNKYQYPNRFALVIGNEDYAGRQPNLAMGANVAYAQHDARIFALYAQHTLGVPEDQVFLITNATAGEMQRELALMEQIIEHSKGRAEVFVYYAGHGYPDPADRTPYLIPVDVNHQNLSSAISLGDLYYRLSRHESQQVTVFLDACFSGGGRDQGLVAARDVRIEPKSDFVPGNLVVFAAASGDQLAYPYHDEGHGLFTYHVLKKLQKTHGKLSYLQMARYLEEEVPMDALKTQRNMQNPRVLKGPERRDNWGEILFLYE